MGYLLDTCTIIWSSGVTDRLSSVAKDLLSDPYAEVFVSAASCSELACAQRRGLKLSDHWKPWFRKALEANGWECLPVTLEIFEEAYSLPEPFHADPMDRIMVATARIHDLQVVTGDGKILAYPHVKSRW